MPSSDERLRPDHYAYATRITTRWIDNDLYGHINNVNYYQFFDTVVNEFLIDQGGMKIHSDDVVAYVVASSCQYRSPISHPDVIQAALRVNHLGNRSVEYGVGIFRGDNIVFGGGRVSGSSTGSTPEASAYGTFTHVYVSRSQDCSVAIPLLTRAALEKLDT